MGLTDSLKTAKPLTVRRINCQISTVNCKKKVTVQKNSGDNNGMMSTVSHKMATVLTASRKSRHPIETLVMAQYTCKQFCIKKLELLVI